MGKKRSRSTAASKPADGLGDGMNQHAQTLVEDVLESRDVEFAAEKKREAKIKRRKMAVELEVAAATKAARAIKSSSKSKTQVKNARKEGLELWRRAAIKRKAEVERQTAAQDVPEEVNGEANDVVDPKMTAKIMKEAREQRAEVRKELLNSMSTAGAKESSQLEQQLQAIGEKSAGGSGSAVDLDDDSDDDAGLSAGVELDAAQEDLDFLDGTRITEDDEMALALFSRGQPGADGPSINADTGDDGPPRIMLADIILQKIREKEEADARAAEIAADPERAARDKKIAEVYGLIGNILSKYRSGKIPKAFKIVPKLKNWEEILYLTRPDEWTPAAVYVSTRLLASNLPAKEVVRFYTDILLPRCLEDISENKKLNYHLYRALEKAIYKPDAFNKGIIFPVCEDAGCTLRQATLIGSVLSKVSIPMLHSAAALLFMSQLPYSPQVCIMMTALVEKNYALPYRVIDALVESFVKMKTDTRKLPVPWHRSLLLFAQRYKMELTMEQKEKLKLLMRVHTHPGITPEIRRELFSARNRGDLMEPDANTIARNIANAAMVR